MTAIHAATLSQTRSVLDQRLPLPAAVQHDRENQTFGLLVTAAIIGGILTIAIIPVTRGRSLEDINVEEMAVAPAYSYAWQARATFAE